VPSGEAAVRIRDVIVPLALVLCALAPERAAGQQAAAPASAPETLATYESRYAEVMGLAGDPSRVGEVKNLVLTRDVARFTLASGKIYLLTAVGGRTVAAVFRGQGVFSFSPPTTIEQDRLVRFEKTKSLEAPFTCSGFSCSI
jgi:hypothetical protein